MSDKWNGKQKGDSEFMPKAPEKAPEPPKDIPRHKRTSEQDGWEFVPESVLKAGGYDYRRIPRSRDLDMRPRYAPRYDMGTAAEQREMRRDWERRNEPTKRYVEEALERRHRDYLDMMYLQTPIFAQGKVIAKRIMVLGDGDIGLLRIDIPTEHETKLAELFEKSAQVAGYAHWWAESDPERMTQTQDAAREIAGALRWDADYWKPAYPEVYDYAAWLSHGVASCENVKRIKVETIRGPAPGSPLLNINCIS